MLKNVILRQVFLTKRVTISDFSLKTIVTISDIYCIFSAADLAKRISGVDSVIVLKRRKPFIGLKV